jgi:hypothetical protein
MYIRKNNSKKKWQKSFINNVFHHKTARNDTFSKIILNDTRLLEGKSDHLPNSLYKFYPPTSDNIIDIKKQRLWLSHPKTFNDPFDCHTGYDVASYVKHALLKYIKDLGYVDIKNSRDGFTIDEFERLSNSTTSYDCYNSKIEEYDTLLWDLKKNKSEDFKWTINDLLCKFRNEVKAKIEELRNVNIRVACFSALNGRKDFIDIIQIWSHYADNHKGFCVEYDLSPLIESNCFPFKNHAYATEQYTEERIRVLMLGCLFPVIYSSSRVNIPKTKLYKIKFDKKNKLQRNSDIDSMLYKTFIVKSAKWNYEKEWRLILDGEVCNYYDNRIPFPYIKRLFLGCKMSTHTIDIMVEIAEELGVEVVMMEMCNEKFTLEQRQFRFSPYKWNKEQTKGHNPLW